MNFFQRLWTCSGIAWRLFKTYTQMLYGSWKVLKLEQPVVTIFGGSRFLQDDPYAVEANKLAQMFVEHNISVLTGGGAGIMEAASCGALKRGAGKGISMGINVSGLEDKNPCVNEYFSTNHFFSRKWLLVRFSTAFVVFPGGFGTLDELAEILTLMMTKKVPKLPIVFIGVEYWEPFMQWLKNEVLAHGAISQTELELFVVTDDLNRAFSLVCVTCKL
ncbi:MAG: TIGR00730 family Rossman fold protein [Candidatus Dependentiae bacterium]|nr:TIGR00730 family Rossman fold protein [Candidatus Dependentiae bacterium]